MDRRAGLKRESRTSPFLRRKATSRKNRGRAYVFVKAKGKRRQKVLPEMSPRQKGLAAVAIILILLTLFSCDLFRRPASQTPAPRDRSANSGSADETSESPDLNFLQRILGHEIPGLGPPATFGGGQMGRTLCSALRSLTGIDPGDPCSVLLLELGKGLQVSLPAVAPPSPDHIEGDPLPETPEPDKPPWGDSAFPFPVPGYSEAPLLLYHTHASEAFTAGSGEFNATGRTVVTVGEELVRLLEEKYGLQVLHHRGVYDQPRRGSYNRARPVIEKIIAENSGIQVVIDLHRDGVARAKTTAPVEGKELGRILLVVGSRNPGYRESLAFSMSLHGELEAVAPGLSRGIYDQDFTYNQDLHPCAILIEVGGHENSIDEALRTLPYLAEALARTYYIYFLQD